MGYSWKRNSLKTPFLNIVSFRRNKDEVGINVHDNEIDAVGLIETWLYATFDGRQLEIDYA